MEWAKTVFHTVPKDPLTLLMDEYQVRAHMATALTAAIRERDAPLLAMLKRLQWLPDSVGYLRCPECFGHAFHEAGFALRALLEEAGK